MKMLEKRDEGLLVRAEPLELARSVCEGLVDEVRTTDGALLLDADPAWAWAINIMLVTKGVMVNELRGVGQDRAYQQCSDGQRSDSEV